MLKDLHIHIEKGEYSKEWIEKFINKAVEMNLSEINLLEHSIRFREFHPAFQQAREYNTYQKKWFEGKAREAKSLDDFKRLADMIKSSNYPIKINFGIEVCWFEQHYDIIAKLTDDPVFDYVLGSVHWIDNWTFNQRKYQWLGKDVNKLYERYYSMSNTLIESEIFDIIAHPDLITCHGIYPDYDLSDTYRNLCLNAVEHGVMIEMNTSKGLGINKQFFDIAKECNVLFSTGSDAHIPENVGRDISKIADLLEK